MRPVRAAGAVALAAALAACGGPGGGAVERPPCGPAPAPIGSPPALPEGFPSPGAVVYTAERQAGPSLIVEGFIPGDIPEVFETYRTAMEEAPGFSVTKDEQERDDAEVFFASDESTGQVKLEQTCAGRTDLTITIRPL